VTAKLLAAVAACVVSLAAHAGPTIWVDDASNEIITVDAATGAVTQIGNAGGPAIFYDIAFNPSGALYGVAADGNLYAISTTNAAATRIGPLGTSALNGLVFSTQGTLYGSGGTSLYTIDTSTGAASLVGSTGSTTLVSAGDLAFLNGTLYETVENPQAKYSALISVSTVNGAATLIGTMVNDPNAYGLVNAGGTLYMVDGKQLYTVDPATAVASLVHSYDAPGLSGANGAAYAGEAIPAIPEPSSGRALLIGLLVVGAIACRRRYASRRAGSLRPQL